MAGVPFENLEQLAMREGAQAAPRALATEGEFSRAKAVERRDKDTKQVYLDLANYLFLEILQRWLGKAGELEVTEMLPSPDQLLWQKPAGRRTSELRIQVIPR